ncbi:MAG: HAMP domain-containing sensor histidine kinase [bacterium]
MKEAGSGPGGRGFSLRWKMLGGTALGLIALMSVVVLLASRAQRDALTEEVLHKISILGESLATELVHPVEEERGAEVFRALRSVAQQRDIRFVTVLDSSRQVLETSDEGFAPEEAIIRTPEFSSAWNTLVPAAVEIQTGGETILAYVAPIVSFDHAIGAVLVGYRQERILQQVNELQESILLIGGTGLVVGLLLMLLLARSITGPLERLKSAAVQVGGGEFGRTVDVETRDEIGALAETFNVMSVELKKREEEIRRAERLSAIGTTASAIAHELKTPLTTLQAYMEMLPKKFQEEEFRQKASDTVLPQVTRLAKLVDDLLDYSRETRLHLMDTNVNLQAHQAVNFMGDVLSAHGITVYEDFSATRLVKADTDKLEQVFFNLLKNAADAMGEGGAVAVLTMDGPAEGQDEVGVLVADSGPGMPPETSSKIFEPFFTTKTRGTGLGLAITSKIIGAHGGSLSVFTPLGTLPDPLDERVREVLGQDWPGKEQGTCFLIALPAVPEA